MSVSEARLRIAHELNQLLRRFRQYEHEADWVRLVGEGAANCASEAAVFGVQGRELRLLASWNFDLLPDFCLDAKEAAAFGAVLSSKEAVTALRTSGEVGTALSGQGLAYLFPILNGSRVAAVLFAGGEEPALDELELVANMAASALERRSNGSAVAIAPLASPQASQSARSLAPWANLPAEHRALHSQAARYARVAVAEFQLLKPGACRAALEKGDLYVALGKEIDEARAIYSRRFMFLPSMTDYFHKELIRSILGGDGTKVGADYPGELS